MVASRCREVEQMWSALCEDSYLILPEKMDTLKRRLSGEYQAAQRGELVVIVSKAQPSAISGIHNELYRQLGHSRTILTSAQRQRGSEGYMALFDADREIVNAVRDRFYHVDETELLSYTGELKSLWAANVVKSDPPIPNKSKRVEETGAEFGIVNL